MHCDGGEGQEISSETLGNNRQHDGVITGGGRKPNQWGHLLMWPAPGEDRTGGAM